MKTRKVIVTLEIQTDVTLARLRNPGNWQCLPARDGEACFVVNQAQVNVVKGMTKAEMIEAMKPKDGGQ